MLNFMNYVTPPPNTMAPWNLTIFSTNTCKMCIFQCELPLLQWVHAFHGYLTLCFHDHYTWVIEPIFAWKSLSKGQQFHNLSRGPQNSYDSKNIATWRSCQSSLCTIWSTETVTKILKQGPWISTLANKTIYCHADFCQKNHFQGVDNESHNLCLFPYRWYATHLQILNKVIKHGRPATIIPRLSPF